VIRTAEGIIWLGLWPQRRRGRGEWDGHMRGNERDVMGAKRVIVHVPIHPWCVGCLRC